MAGFKIVSRILWGVGIAVFGSIGCRQSDPTPSTPRASAPDAAPLALHPPLSQMVRLVYPTEQDLLAGRGRPGVFQPTHPDRPESALFGSVRSAGSLQGEVPSFHEGVDIAPLKRDRHGRPMDTVRAIADGIVAYVNRSAGNSAYGCYVVLAHEDPVGPVYSLYAHLARVASSLNVGGAVEAGTELGVMGNTANYRIPVQRAHLHLEIGLMANARFRDWFRNQRLKPDHGAFNGWNLWGTDPLAVYEHSRESDSFTFLDHMSRIPAAFEWVVKSSKLPDYFARYPRLWIGKAYEGRAMVLRCSESGLVLSGRNATDEECQALGTSEAGVLSVDEAVLGRNGLRLIVRNRDGWTPGPGSRRWLDIFLH